MPDLLDERGLPVNPEAERMVLGAAMIGTDFSLISPPLQERDFATEDNRRIFRAMAEMDASGKPIDRITVANELRDRKQLDSVGGLTYLVSLDEGMPELANLDGYVSIVRDKSTLRRAIQTYQRAINECLLAQAPTADLLARAERAIADLSAEGSGGVHSMIDVLNEAGGPRFILDPETHSRGIGTPWGRLNQCLEGGGLQRGDMIVVGGRPSSGKTAIACDIAAHAAFSGNPVVFFSIEMREDALLRRIAGARAQVDMLRYGQGRGTEPEKRALRQALIDLTEQCQLYIACRCYTLAQMRATLVKFCAKHPLGLGVIDYLQLMVPTDQRRNRNEQVSEISRGVKRLAEEFRAPFLVLSQLSRDSDKETRAPRPSDLRDSGSIEQDADLILFPYRIPDQPDNRDELQVDLLIAKQRNGAIGKVPLVFHRRFTTFEER